MKSWMKAKLDRLFNPYCEMLLSGMVHLWWGCLLDVNDYIV